MRKYLLLVVAAISVFVGAVSVTGCSKEGVSSIVLSDGRIAGGYLQMSVGEVTLVSVTVTPADKAQYLIWSSSNPSVADAVAGYVRAVAPGTAEITVSSVNGKSASFHVIVSKRDITKWSHPSTLEVAPGHTNEFEVKILEAPGMTEDNKSYYSAASLDLKIEGNGASYFSAEVVENTVKVKCKSDAPQDGSCKATLTLTNVSKTNTSSVSLVAIFRPVTSVSISPSSLSELVIGESVTLTASIYPSNATIRDLKWTSTGGVTISPDGNKCVVTGSSAGNANVTVASPDNPSATCSIKVVEPYVKSLSVTFSETILCAGSDRKVEVAVNPSDFEYKIVNNTPSLIDIEDGVVKNVKGTGAASFTVTAGAKSVTKKFLVADKNFKLQLGVQGDYNSDLKRYQLTQKTSFKYLPYSWIYIYPGIAGYALGDDDEKELAKCFGTVGATGRFLQKTCTSTDFEQASDATNAVFFVARGIKNNVSGTVKFTAATGQSATASIAAKLSSITVYSGTQTHLGTTASSGTVINSGTTITVYKSKYKVDYSWVYFAYNTDASYNSETPYSYPLNLLSANSSALKVNSTYDMRDYIEVPKSIANGTYKFYIEQLPDIYFNIKVVD